MPLRAPRRRRGVLPRILPDDPPTQLGDSGAERGLGDPRALAGARTAHAPALLQAAGPWPAGVPRGAHAVDGHLLALVLADDLTAEFGDAVAERGLGSEGHLPGASLDAAQAAYALT